MANESAANNNKTLLLCSSKPLAKWLRTIANKNVDVYDVEMLLKSISTDFIKYEPPLFSGIEDSLKSDLPKYDAIFIDEAQDFTEGWAYAVKSLLKEETNSRLGVFFDDVQHVLSNKFSDYFMLDTPPFLLRENIRNTSSIYNWAMEKTSLGRDVIVNPVEGPIPIKEDIRDKKHLIQRLESILKEFIDDEGLGNESLVILVEEYEEFMRKFDQGIAKWKFTNKLTGNPDEVLVSSVTNFKGLEANMVIYIHTISAPDNINYIAYTRAKFYLHELVVK